MFLSVESLQENLHDIHKIREVNIKRKKKKKKKKFWSPLMVNLSLGFSTYT